MRRTARAILTALLAGAALACDAGSDHQQVDALASRVDQLEKRLAAAEKAAEPVDRIVVETGSLDRRVSSLETNVRDLASRPAPVAPGTPGAPATAGPMHPTMPGGPATWGPTTQQDRIERRVQLRALSEEFRSKLAALRNEPPDSEKYQEVLAWYREQRRSVLRGQGRTDQVAPTQ